MRIESHNVLGLLMAPNRLPSCFSCEEFGDLPEPCSVPPPGRLRAARNTFSRALAARRAESRKRSAAAW